MVAILRKGLASKLSIEPNIIGCLYKLENSIFNYYKVSKYVFVDNKKDVFQQYFIYVQKTSFFRFYARFGKIARIRLI